MYALLITLYGFLVILEKRMALPEDLILSGSVLSLCWKALEGNGISGEVLWSTGHF